MEGEDEKHGQPNNNSYAADDNSDFQWTAGHLPVFDLHFVFFYAFPSPGQEAVGG